MLNFLGTYFFSSFKEFQNFTPFFLILEFWDGKLFLIKTKMISSKACNIFFIFTPFTKTRYFFLKRNGFF